MSLEHGAPAIPPIRDKYGLTELAIGESKFIVYTDTKLHSVMRAVSQHGKRRKKKFICRIVSEHGRRGVRVWRLDDPE